MAVQSSHPKTAESVQDGKPEQQFCEGLIPLLGLVPSSGIGISKQFTRFAPFLAEMVSLSPSQAMMRYPDDGLWSFSSGEPARLLAACEEHRAASVPGLREGPVLLLVYPLAPYLRRWDTRAEVMLYGSADVDGAQAQERTSARRQSPNAFNRKHPSLVVKW